MSHQLLKALYDWAFNVVTPVPVVWQFQNGPRTSNSFLLLNISSINSSSNVNYSTRPDNSGNSSTRNDYSLVISVNSYGDNALGNLQKLLEQSRKFSAQKLLRDNGLGYLGPVNNILNLTDLIGTNYEPRFQCDFNFNYSTESIEFVSWIQTVLLRSELTLENNTKYIRTVTINP